MSERKDNMLRDQRLLVNMLNKTVERCKNFPTDEKSFFDLEWLLSHSDITFVPLHWEYIIRKYELWDAPTTASMRKDLKRLQDLRLQRATADAGEQYSRFLELDKLVLSLEQSLAFNSAIIAKKLFGTDQLFNQLPEQDQVIFWIPVKDKKLMTMIERASVSPAEFYDRMQEGNIF